MLPAIIGVILGPAAEQQMRRALQLSDGDLTGLVNTPFSIVVYVVIAVLLFFPLIRKLVTPTKPAALTPEREKVDA